MNWKKWLLAFLILDVALMAAGWGLARLAPSTPASRAIAEETEFVSNSLRADLLRWRVENKDPFVPPADGRFTARQLQATLDVWRTVDPELDRAHSALFHAHFRAWPMGSQSSPALKKASRLLRRRQLAINVQAMPAQLVVLNRHRMSLAEYHWLKVAVSEAIARQGTERVAKMVLAGHASISGPPGTEEAFLAENQPATGALAANIALVSGLDASVNPLQGSQVGF